MYVMCFRIQQLQLLGRSDMTGEARDRLWSQLEAEILVQRHKTVMRAVRRDQRAPSPTSTGIIRTVELHRRLDQGLGISIMVNTHCCYEISKPITFEILNYTHKRCSDKFLLLSIS